MFNFIFKTRDKGVKEYTAKEVHADLAAMMLLFITDIQKETELLPVPKSLSEDLNLLVDLGFTKSRNAQMAAQAKKAIIEHNKAHEEKKAALDFMLRAWETFGRETMVVRYEQFLPILEKYNLTCGSFDRYKGAIPAKNLHDIRRVTGILESKGKGMTERFRYIYSADTDRNNLRWLQYFNLYPLEETVREPLFRFMGVNVDRPMGDTQRIFIAAPAQEMEDFEIMTYSSKAIVEETERNRNRVRTTDPFICSLTPYGVMIFSKWGDESDDPVIKRYEELRDAVIGG